MILTAAVKEKVHRGVEDPEQAWILGELIRYLEHPSSGAMKFDDMGTNWVAVRDGAHVKFLEATTRAGAIRTLESLVRIEEGAQGGRLPCPPGSLLTGFFPIPGGPPGRPHPPTSHRLVQTAKIFYLQFLQATTRAGAIRTLESLARIELGAEGGALVECVATTRTAKNGATTTTVRERYTAAGLAC